MSSPQEPPRKKLHQDDEAASNGIAAKISNESNAASDTATSSHTAASSDTATSSHTAASSDTATSSHTAASSDTAASSHTTASSDTAASAEDHSSNDGTTTHPAPLTLADLSSLSLVRLLSPSDSPNSNYSVAVEAKHDSVEGRVIIQMQKTPFDPAHLPRLLSGSTHLSQLFSNDVYSKHTAVVPQELNKVQVSIVHPATAQHFLRYERHLCSVVEETAQLYRQHTEPFLSSKKANSNQWIYNILSGSSEADRVLLRDTDPHTGFVLLPDMKWTGEQVTDLYCQALVQRRDLRSLRDLRGDLHLDLLRNIKEKGASKITSLYGLPTSRLRIYLHYLPSYYHLHVHFAALAGDAPGTWCGKAHLLSDVISNLESDPLHYAKATISFTVKDNHPHPLAKNNVQAREQQQQHEEEEGDMMAAPGGDKMAAPGGDKMAAPGGDKMAAAANGNKMAAVDTEDQSVKLNKADKNNINEKRKLDEMNSAQ